MYKKRKWNHFEKKNQQNVDANLWVANLKKKNQIFISWLIEWKQEKKIELTFFLIYRSFNSLLLLQKTYFFVSVTGASIVKYWLNSLTFTYFFFFVKLPKDRLSNWSFFNLKSRTSEIRLFLFCNFLVIIKNNLKFFLKNIRIKLVEYFPFFS